MPYPLCSSPVYAFPLAARGTVSSKTRQVRAVTDPAAWTISRPKSTVPYSGSFRSSSPVISTSPLATTSPLLDHRVPLLRLNMGDDSVGFGDNIKKARFVQTLRRLNHLPNDDFQPGAMEIKGHPGQVIQRQKGLLRQLFALK